MVRICLFAMLWPFYLCQRVSKFVIECVNDTFEAMAACRVRPYVAAYANPQSNMYVALKHLGMEAKQLDLAEFQERVIDRGIQVVKREYPEPCYARLVHGAVMGFEACRGKTPEELKLLFESANLAFVKARNEHDPDLSWYRAYEGEVHWVCNCVSVILMERGQPVILAPTKRGMLGAAGILGLLGRGD